MITDAERNPVRAIKEDDVVVHMYCFGKRPCENGIKPRSASGHLHSGKVTLCGAVGRGGWIMRDVQYTEKTSSRRI